MLLDDFRVLNAGVGIAREAHGGYRLPLLLHVLVHVVKQIRAGS